jgi:Cu-processing system permease protein
VLSAAFLGLFLLGFSFAYGKAVENADLARNRLATALASTTLTLMGLYAVNFLSSFLALFVAVGAVSAEVDAGTLHAVLARPVRRSEFVLGRWIAYVGMLIVYVTTMAGAIFAIARWIADYEPVDAPRAALLMGLSAALLMTLSLFGSTWLSTLANGVVVFSLFGLAWLAGIIEVIGTALQNGAMVDLGIAISLLVPSDGLWRGASYYVQSPIALAIASSAPGGGNPFIAVAPPADRFVLWAAGYVVVCLLGSLAVFRARDL